MIQPAPEPADGRHTDAEHSMQRDTLEAFLDIEPERGYEEQLRAQQDTAGPPAEIATDDDTY